MQNTTHINQRMSQRGMTKPQIQVALDYGNLENDRYVLGRREIDATLSRIAKEKEALLQVRKKGGLVVVAADNHLITTYRLQGRRSR